MQRLTLALSAIALFLTACAGPPVGDPSPAALGDPSTESPSEWSGVTRNVPSEFPNIQSAVDAVDPGDLILIDRGVYLESVSVTTPGLTSSPSKSRSASRYAPTSSTCSSTSRSAHSTCMQRPLTSTPREWENDQLSVTTPSR